MSHLVKDYLTEEKINLHLFDYIQYSTFVYDALPDAEFQPVKRCINPLPLFECYVQCGHNRAQKLIEYWNNNLVNKMAGQKYFYRLESIQENKPNPDDLYGFHVTRLDNLDISIITFKRF